MTPSDLDADYLSTCRAAVLSPTLHYYLPALVVGSGGQNGDVPVFVVEWFSAARLRWWNVLANALSVWLLFCSCLASAGLAAQYRQGPALGAGTDSGRRGAGGRPISRLSWLS